MVFTLGERLPASKPDLLPNIANSIVRLASMLPKTFISKHPQVPNFAAEFYQRDNLLDAKIFRTDSTTGPFAYKLDLAACQTLINGPAQSCRVALVFDVGLEPDKYSNSGLTCDWEYTGNSVFTLNHNKIINRLVLVSDQKLPGLQQLKWDSAETAHYIKTVTEDDKFAKIASSAPAGVFMAHTENELLIQAKQCELSLGSASGNLLISGIPAPNWDDIERLPYPYAK